MSEHEFEPVPGLPERLPPGEVILWQGAPKWSVLARRAFHLRLVGGYFVLLLAVSVWTVLQEGASLADAADAVVILSALGLCASGLFAFYAWLISRSTLYTITNRRLVMRFGVALPISINLPFVRIQAAAVKCFANGYGDIPVTLDKSHRVPFFLLWPHVRPWRLGRPEPMLRAIPDAWSAAEILAEAASQVVPEVQAADETKRFKEPRRPSVAAYGNDSQPALAAGEMS